MNINKQHILLEQLSNTFTTIPFNRMLGLKLEHVDDTHVIINFNMNEELIGNFVHGILHGGVISSVLDTAGGMAVMASLVYKNSDKPVEELIDILGRTSTIDIQISYLRPGLGNVFTAKAWLLKSGKKISFTRMELSNQDDTLIAIANGTFSH